MLAPTIEFWRLIERISRSVDAHPSDESPFGVRGLAGNVREMRLGVQSRATGERVVVLKLKP